uniref:Uncharacterized protein n=1 Tax=viral metagenome TaxID=1070528 RepID=A0A6C0DKL3_9ZZZZ
MEDYSLVGQPWGDLEDQQLIKEYTIDKLTLMQLCKIHKRKPGGISSRLSVLKLIDRRDTVRGYAEYKESDLYKEICKTNLENRTSRKEIKKQSNTTIDPMVELRKDVNELKKDVKEILRLMNALYEFEASQG